MKLERGRGDSVDACPAQAHYRRRVALGLAKWGTRLAAAGALGWLAWPPAAYMVAVVRLAALDGDHPLT